MRLNDILEGLEAFAVNGGTDAAITGISYDSRKAEDGHLFVAVRGEHADGHNFIGAAIARGAAAVVCEQVPEGGRYEGISFIRVADSRNALAAVANNFYGRPSEALCVIGVTGTNGKTTTTYLIKSILETWGKKTGLVGTIRSMIGNEVSEAEHTTPEAPEFQGLLHKMRTSGCTHVVSEVSSHALAQKRVDGTVFRAGVFTNLTRDHLDFHQTMEEYFLAKERLFRELLAGAAVINYDDAYGRRLLSDIAGLQAPGKGVLTYGLETGADLTASDIHDSFKGLQFTIIADGIRHRVRSSFVGLPNVYNILSAAGATLALGVPWEVILRGIRNAGPVTGRFEKVDAGQKFLAVVDYAHTEDALERLIYTARGLTEGRVITVFGCGGDRDRGKRPRMAAVATKLSDLVVITSDNPRSEDPGKIITEVEAGAVKKNYLVEPDRRQAIQRAILLADNGDVVLVAGKGHEDCQIIGGRSFHFSDREVLEEAIRQLVKND
ncbi:MAG: UDP-N-acetylmuramoyl-L-alanyl-D-glutamate--2,6-diaminopimelate ligase [Nitrospiraceae bacterium]|nr:UDP-N-acetylmuramoyl-L-alanyl-D-glutamate--2,6-diaminopimelate ligase [Nitrospiraceae bacterium]